MGIVQTRAEGPDGSGGVALFGLDPGTTFPAPTRDGDVDLSAGAAAALGATAGDEVTIAGQSFRVAAVDGDLSYSHTPVVSMTSAAWKALDQRIGGRARRPSSRSTAPPRGTRSPRARGPWHPLPCRA